MTTLLSDPSRRKFTHGPKMWTAGSPPPPSVMRRFEEELGVTISTAYGLTETYGPISTHIPQDGPELVSSTENETVDALSVLTHQVMDAGMTAIKVLNPETMQEVPADSRTLGEVMIKGNVVMAGYFKNPTATEESFADGWFHSGDLAVNHGNGRFEIKDRSKGKKFIILAQTHTFLLDRRPVILRLLFIQILSFLVEKTSRRLRSRT